MPFDAIMEHVAVPEDVIVQAGTVGGVPGWWSKPEGAQPDAVTLHIHGGWFNWGSAKAFRNLVGHLVIHAGAFAFSPDYRLVPEHPFPAAPEDVHTCYAGLIELGYKGIAVTGDSAGGTLALGLLLSLFSAVGTSASSAAFCWSGCIEPEKLDCSVASGFRGSAGLMSRRWCGRLKTLHLFRIEDKIMLKLNNLALCALVLFPIALTAQTPVTSAAQTQTTNGHCADEAAIEQVMKQYHAAILAHDGTTLSGLFLPDANSLAERSDRLRIRSGAGKVG